MSARRSLAWSLLRHGLLGLGALVMLAPFVWMLVTSGKPPQEIFLDHLRLWPQESAFVANYTAAWTKVPLGRFLLNGLVVTVAIFALQVLVTLPCAYALAKLRFRGRRMLTVAILLGLLIPPHAISVPLFLLMHHLGILDSYVALVLPFTISVFGIFLMRQFFLTIPDDLVDAARMDGMSEFAIVWRVMLPSAVPASRRRLCSHPAPHCNLPSSAHTRSLVPTTWRIEPQKSNAPCSNGMPNSRTHRSCWHRWSSRPRRKPKRKSVASSKPTTRLCG